MRKPRPGTVPLERALSKLGIASRTQAREWILAGKMRVNGVYRKDPSFPVRPETAKIEVEGRALEAPRARLVIAFHKPTGLVTTRKDEKERATVFAALDERLHARAGNLHAVGRLDQATSGLLLLTNDSRLSAWLTDPESGIPRVYLVTVRGEVSPGRCTELEAGISSGAELLRAESVQLRKASRRESHLTVTLAEGKNREVRRMFLELGHEVTRLRRVSFGGIELEGLASGKHREVGEDELALAFPGLPKPGDRRAPH